MRIKNFYLLLLLLCSISLNAQEQENFISLEKKTHWVNQIQDITELPVGIRENKNGVEYAIMVTKATFSSNETTVNIYMPVLPFPIPKHHLVNVNSTSELLKFLFHMKDS